LIKQLRGYSYEELPFRIADSWSVHHRFIAAVRLRPRGSPNAREHLR
jgi:hypothetical protein